MNLARVLNIAKRELSGYKADALHPRERRILREDYRDWRVRLLGAVALTLDVAGVAMPGDTGFWTFAVGAGLTGLFGVVLGRVRRARLGRAS